MQIHSNGITIQLKEVYYNHYFSNLISGLVWGEMAELYFRGPSQGFWYQGKKIFKFSNNDTKLIIKEEQEVRSTSTSIKAPYERYGYIFYNTLLKLLEFQGVTHMMQPTCEAYKKGKSTKLPAYK